MGSLCIEVFYPLSDQHTRLEHRSELLGVQKLVAHQPVEAFDDPVLLGSTLFDEQRADLTLVQEFGDCCVDELASIVLAHEHRATAVSRLAKRLPRRDRQPMQAPQSFDALAIDAQPSRRSRAQIFL